MNTLKSEKSGPQSARPSALRHKIRICLGSSCFSKAKQSNLEYIEQFLKQYNLIETVDFAGHLCIDHCISGPNIEIDGIMHSEVDTAKLEEILKKQFEIA